MLGAANPRTPFFVAAALAVLNMLYGWFVLPESLSVKNRRPFSLVRANPLGAFAHFGKLPRLRLLFMVSLLYSFAHLVYPSTWNFYCDARYGWGAKQIGWSLMAWGICAAIVQGGLIGPVIKRLGEFKTAVLGLAINVVSFIGFAFATNEWLLYMWIPISALGAIAGPSVNAIMSRRVPPDGQGELQGAISSVSAIANMGSPLLMTQAFSFFLSADTPVRFHGGAFILAAMLTLAAMVPLIFSGSATEPKS